MYNKIDFGEDDNYPVLDMKKHEYLNFTEVFK